MHRSRRYPTGQKSEIWPGYIGQHCTMMSLKRVIQESSNAVIACTFHLGPKLRNLVMSRFALMPLMKSGFHPSDLDQSGCPLLLLPQDGLPLGI